MIRFEMNLFLQYLLVNLSSVVFAFLVYETIVTKWRITRFLFGMKK